MDTLIGQTLSHYRIVEKIGAGGMGEVYRAHDTRLGRDVAIKVLPQHLSATPEIRARFEHEARTISQLNHAHICTLYDVGHQEGIDFLVMELVEGEALTQRLLKGPLPTAEVLRFGAQIADALDRAHRAGVIHRDLKPGNVMLTKSGAKLMDFGLARSAPPVQEEGALAESPTMSRPLTAEGTIVGTFQYMAPEQLEGKEADARTDIWALGCVLYEMATATRAFEGKSQASLISAIMKDEPRPIAELQPLSPPALERLVKQCLAKDPDGRWQSAADIGRELTWVAEAGSRVGVPAVVAARRRVRRRAAWALGAVLGMAVAVLVVWQMRQPPVKAPAVAFDVELPGGLHDPSTPALSPDGRWLVFVANDSTDVRRVCLRATNSREVKLLPGAEGVTINATPFWSPDSRSIAYFGNGKLMRVSLEGGPAQELSDAPDPRGGSWGKGDVILFAPGSQGPICRVPATGGAPVAVTKVAFASGEISHRFPCFLPDGRRFLYVSTGSGGGSHATFLGSLEGSAPRHVLDANSVAVYAPPGQVVFNRQGVLMAQGFDPGSARLNGQPRVLLSDVLPHQLGSHNFSLSGNGLLACATGKPGRDRLYWYARSGHQTGPASSVLPRCDGHVVLSPDARQTLYVASDSRSGRTQMWLVDLKSGLATSLNLGDAGTNGALWSPDARKVYFTTRPQGRDEIHSWSLDGAEGEKLIFRPSTLLCTVGACTPDGAHLVVALPGQAGHYELWLVPTAGVAADTARCLLRGPFSVGAADVSTDGRWLAYSSKESGQYEVYVTTFPVPGARHRVSPDGGTLSRWVRGGRELLFLSSPDRIMAADFSTGTGLPVGTPRELFRLPKDTHGLAVTRDGERFLLALPGEAQPARHLTMLVNWQNAEAR